MAGLIRIFFSMILSALAARVVDSLMSPKSKQQPIEPNAKEKPLPALDLTPCPVCGVYTTQPAMHCKV